MRDTPREICPKRLMVTSSLLDSIDFHVKMKAGSEWSIKSLDQLKKTLARTNKFESTPFTQRGQDFEKQVCSFSRVNQETFLEMMKKFCSCDVEKLLPFYQQVAGGEFQRTVKADWDIGGQKVFLYGKEDVYHPGKIVDIKTTSSEWKTGKYSSESNYKGRSQHSLYMTIDGVHDFNYIIAEFINLGTKDEPVWSVVDVHEVPIHIEDLEEEKRKLEKRITSALDFIWQDESMWANFCDVYTRSW